MPKPAQPEPDDARLEGATESMPEQVESAQAADSLPTHKDDLVALAIERGVPSYEAWALTVADLTEKLES